MNSDETLRWISIDQSRNINRFGGVDKVIEDARKIYNFLSNRSECQILILTKTQTTDAHHE
jgi:hypothetical protein